MHMASFSYTHTGEALIFDSLQEIIKIWSRGSGQARFTLDINDGVGEMKLSFNLGIHSPNATRTETRTQYQAQPHILKPRKKRRRKRKSPSQLARDKARAQSYHARQAQKSTIVLPFAGQILPISKTNALEVDDTLGDRKATPTHDDPQDRNSLKPCEVPMKMCSGPKHLHLDVSSAKKELFPPKTPSVKADTQCQGPSYQQKESELWTKLFN